MNNKYKIYCITNRINNKKYIGVTKNDLKERVSEAQKLTNSFHIGDVCNGKRKKSNNLTWRWYCES